MTKLALYQQTLHKLATNPTCQEIFEREPDLPLVLQSFVIHPPQGNRWHAYEAMKHACNSYVGWDARHTELATPHHYHALIDVIEQLLEVIDSRADEDEQ